MRLQTENPNLVFYEGNVAERLGKVHLVTAAPSLGQMEVGEMWALDASGGTATDYKLYIKVDLSTIVVFEGASLIT